MGAFHSRAQSRPELAAIQGSLGHRQFLRNPQQIASKVHGAGDETGVQSSVKIKDERIIGAESSASHQAPSLRLLPFPPWLAFCIVANGG
ncbi:MAG: hypothetical protein LUQ38_12050 [Methanotrichaceae archaeon]|nr:hypothetical protein [Methanotrichaceae archaeon]